MAAPARATPTDTNEAASIPRMKPWRAAAATVPAAAAGRVCAVASAEPIESWAPASADGDRPEPTSAWPTLRR